MATPAQWVAGARPRTLPAAAGARARRHRCRRGARRLPRRARRCSRWSSRSRCRSRSTTPTTTPTAGAAPTPTGSGPMRLVGLRAPPPRGRCWWPPRLAFARGRASPGLGLAALSSWWLVAVGAVCIAAAWTYTGGPLPYGYRALGEVFVFVFFGLVAVVGTTFVQTRTLRRAGVRRRGPDRAAHRGDPGGQQPARHRRRRARRQADAGGAARRPARPALLFAGLFVVAFAVVAAVGRASGRGRCWGCSPRPLAVPPARTVLSGGRGPALIGALAGHGAAHPGHRRPAGRGAGPQRLSEPRAGQSVAGPLSRVAQLLLGRAAGHAARRERLGEPLAHRLQHEVGHRHRQQQPRTAAPG